MKIEVDETKLITLLDFAEAENFERLAGDAAHQDEVDNAIEDVRDSLATARQSVGAVERCDCFE